MKKLLTLVVVVLLSIVAFSPATVFAADKDKACKTIDGAYFGKNGKETDKGTYEKECVSHTCELVADAYFGKDGTEVSQAQFEKECEATVVNEIPDTGSNSYINILFLILGLSIVSYSCLRISTIKE